MDCAPYLGASRSTILKANSVGPLVNGIGFGCCGIAKKDCLSSLESNIVTDKSRLYMHTMGFIHPAVEHIALKSVVIGPAFRPHIPTDKQSSVHVELF